MTNEQKLLGAFALALAVTLLATPLAIRAAAWLTFHDTPDAYKGHTRATPYLGGAAVMLGALGAGLAFGDVASRFTLIIALAGGLWALGTYDDWRPIGALPRLAAEVVAGTVLWLAGLGWDVFPGATFDFVLTVFWVVALVNAFNLMDNMDGATSSVAGVCSLGTGILALSLDEVGVAVLAFGLGGACAGFLRYNLAGPARIFLGDGGSMPIGFLAAASIMALPLAGGVGWPGLLVGCLLVGLPILDTALVIVSRRRRGISILTGGLDHLTHRLRRRLDTPRNVALAMAVIQAVLCTGAYFVNQLERDALVALCATALLVLALAIVIFETAFWAPDGHRPHVPDTVPVSGHET